MKVTLTDGFEIEVPETIKDDYELFELLCDLDNGKTTKLPETIRKMLGEDGEKALKEHLRKENGIIRITDMQKAVMEILKSDDLKK